MMAAETCPFTVPLDRLLAAYCDDPIEAGVAIRGLASDSRLVQPGDVFFAVRGEREHGLAHLDQAVQRGAAACAWEPVAGGMADTWMRGCRIPGVAIENLSQRLGYIAGDFYQQPSRAMHCIGITGTDGKTSVAHFIAQALHGADTPCGLLGTLGYGIYGALQAPTHTTPDALRLQAELAALRDQKVAAVVMEVSSHGLDQGRVAGVDFDTAVFTNLSREHLDYHGDMQAYAAAKRALFRWPGLQNVVLNTDDSFGEALFADATTTARKIAYSVDPGSDIRRRATAWLQATRIEAHAQGLRIELDSSWGAAAINTRLLGAFNAANLLASLGALLAAGLDFDTAVQRLSGVNTVAGRMESFGGDRQPLVVIDYAHTANALATALQALRPHCRGRLICVFGAGGDRDAGKRPEMGAVAERLADRVIITNDNPRHENPEAILDAIAAGAGHAEAWLRIPDRAEAIRRAIRTAASGDVVLVAGKGHEAYQQVGSQRHAFSDRQQVCLVLEELSG